MEISPTRCLKKKKCPQVNVSKILHILCHPILKAGHSLACERLWAFCNSLESSFPQIYFIQDTFPSQTHLFFSNHQIRQMLWHTVLKCYQFKKLKWEFLRNGPLSLAHQVTLEEPHGWGWMEANVTSLCHSLQWYAVFHLTSLSFCFPYKGARVIPASIDVCCEDYIQKFILSVFKCYKNLHAFRFNFASDSVATSIFLSQFDFNRNDCFKHVLLPSHLQGHSSSCVAH